MQIGIVGLGRTGAKLARRLARGGVDVVGFDPDGAASSSLAGEGVLDAAPSVVALVRRLHAPRVVLMRVPAGRTTEIVVEDIWPELARGELIVDAGHAHYRDCVRREAALAAAGVRFVDCGIVATSAGADGGYAVMYGGSDEAAARFEPYARILAPRPDAGWLHCGRCGAGQFASMVHGGIEAAMTEAYGEGLALIASKTELGLDIAQVAETWRHAGGVRSSLLDRLAAVLRGVSDPALVEPLLSSAIERRWSASEAIDQAVPTPVMSIALAMQFARGRRSDSTVAPWLRRYERDETDASITRGASS